MNHSATSCVQDRPARWRTRLSAGASILGICINFACSKAVPSVHGDAGAGVHVEPSVAAAPILDSGSPDTPMTAVSRLPANLNVLVLSIDSLRADMPWAGYPRPIAPRLTELEKRAVSYTHAYAISSYTSMSLGGFLGGKLPSGMPRSGFFFGKYAPENVMFPELLKARGVRTMAAHAHGYFKDSGFDQGFDVYEIVQGIAFKNDTDPNVTSPQHEALAEKILSDPALDTSRFFAWFHFLDPHDQYMPHDKDGIPPFGPKLRDRYDAEVLYTDGYIGKLLDFVEQKPWGKRTAIVVTADHGEGFGEHNRFAHGFELWENLVRVPLFIVVPGLSPRRIDTPRSTLDLAPTILEMLSASEEIVPDKPPTFEGTSLVPELLGGAAEERDVVLDLPMTSDNDKRRAIVRGNKKIIAFGKEESLRLFDLETDPGEDKPITSGEAFDAMAQRYRAFSKTAPFVMPYACGAGCLNREYANPAKASSSARH